MNVDKTETDRLVAVIKNGEWKDALNASDILGKYLDDYTFNELIKLLSDSKAHTRNAAALALREIKNNNAVEYLLKAINDPSNINDRSTLVYALETLDCSNCFLEILPLALTLKEDVKNSALNILFEQGFYISDKDLSYAKELIDTFRKSGISEKDLNLIGELIESLEV